MRKRKRREKEEKKRKRENTCESITSFCNSDINFSKCAYDIDSLPELPNHCADRVDFTSMLGWCRLGEPSCFLSTLLNSSCSKLPLASISNILKAIKKWSGGAECVVSQGVSNKLIDILFFLLDRDGDGSVSMTDYLHLKKSRSDFGHTKVLFNKRVLPVYINQALK